MPKDRFQFIMIQIPDSINFDVLSNIYLEIDNLDAEKANALNKILKLEVSKDQGSLNEKDLFEIGDEFFLQKKCVQDFLKKSIDEVLIPRLHSHTRISSAIHMDEFSYLNIDEKTYAIAGHTAGYYTARVSEGYKMLLSISLSNLLEPYIKAD